MCIYIYINVCVRERERESVCVCIGRMEWVAILLSSVIL